MTTREAIRILMLSPCYFLLPPISRKQLVREYRELFAQSVKNDKK